MFGFAFAITLYDGCCKMEDLRNFNQLRGEWKKSEKKLKDDWKKAEKRFEEETAKTREERKKLMEERQRLSAMFHVRPDQNGSSGNDVGGAQGGSDGSQVTESSLELPPVNETV